MGVIPDDGSAAVKSLASIDAVHLAWLLRADVRDGAPASGEPPEWFRLWWLLDGRREYPVWATQSHPQSLADLLKPLPGGERLGLFGMTPLLRYLVERRKDVADAFDVNTEQGLWHAIAWLFAHGLREHGLLDSVDAATLAALDDTPSFLRLEVLPARQQPALTWLMFLIWQSGSDLQQAFDLRTPEGQAAFLPWFFLDGVPKLQLAPLVAPRWRAWLRQPVALQGAPSTALPRVILLLWQRRGELKQAFDLRKPQDVAALARWAEEAWQREPVLRWLTETPPRASSSAAEAVSLRDGRDVRGVRPFGLNLIGFAFGELGIGEDVRMAAAACERAGIPFAVVNINPGEKLRQADRVLADHVAATGQGEEEAPYAINLFCLTGFDTARVFLERGLSLFRGRYNIGWWPWELPVWPQDWRVAFDLVDEVWAATEFTRKMYSAVSPTPVSLMPLPASVARVEPVARRALGLPARRFLFLYVFDFNSFLARKNPFAAVKAFREAFPANDDSVGLVLKTMNSNPANPAWKRFLRECARDARIVLLDRTMDRGQVLGLIQTCDAYVSLHRSEGFGRTLAEAMLFGKPVVGTDFSGNVDFLTAETGFPVKWRRRMVKESEYPFVTEPDGAWWAEPDVRDAARQMQAAREAAKNKAFTARVRSYGEERFSPARIGSSMHERVEAVYRQLAGYGRAEI